MSVGGLAAIARESAAVKRSAMQKQRCQNLAINNNIARESEFSR
jgi:hypothetical protein